MIVNNATHESGGEGRVSHLTGEIVNSQAVNEAGNGESRPCLNPVCRVPVQTHPKAIYEKRHCSDRCRLDAWTIRKAGELLSRVSHEEAMSIIEATIEEARRHEPV